LQVHYSEEAATAKATALEGAAAAAAEVTARHEESLQEARARIAELEDEVVKKEAESSAAAAAGPSFAPPPSIATATSPATSPPTSPSWGDLPPDHPVEAAERALQLRAARHTSEVGLCRLNPVDPQRLKAPGSNP
jgi:hypothetical protein